MRVGRRLLGILLLCALVTPGWADQRTQNIDVMIALDKSLSMEDKVGAVERWVDSAIIDQMLIPGDYFTVIAFYGKADVVISQTLASDADKVGLKKAVDAIRGTGRFTDIGNALDVLKSQLASRDSDGREKYVLLLTDGIQEAPPTSKYYSKNGSFNHEFLDNTKTIPEKGWKIMILGVGTASAAKELAGQLQGGYAPVGTKPTEQALSEGSNALFSTVTLQGDATLSSVSAAGRSTLSFTLKANGLKGKTLITLGGIAAVVGPTSLPNLLPQPFSFSLPGDGEQAVRVPVQFPSQMQPGKSKASLTFSFFTPEQFTPTQISVDLTVNTWVQDNLYVAGGGLLILLLLIAAAAFLVPRLARGQPLAFQVLVGDEPLGEGPSTLPSGRELFLTESEGAFSLLVRRNARSVARFSAQRGKLLMTILKSDRFPKVKEAPADDVRGQTFPMRSETGKNLSLKIQ